MKILSIDAWREDHGWTWNQWFCVGSITKKEFETLDTTRKVLKFFREEMFLTEHSKGKCEVDDDGYNITILDRSNHRPLFAIEYGPHY